MKDQSSPVKQPDTATPAKPVTEEASPLPFGMFTQDSGVIFSSWPPEDLCPSQRDLAPDDLRALGWYSPDELAARIVAAFRLAASVCDDLVQRAKADREQAINREDTAVLGREMSTAMACRDAILALGEHAGK